MLPKENRLTGKETFESVKKEGNIYQGSCISLLAKKRTRAGPTRIGFIISNKISKKATQRNRIRRILKNIILPYLLSLQKNFDLIILAKRKIIDTDKIELNLEIRKIFKKSNLI